MADKRDQSIRTGDRPNAANAAGHGSTMKGETV